MLEELDEFGNVASESGPSSVNTNALKPESLRYGP